MRRYFTLLIFIGLAWVGCDNNESCIYKSKIQMPLFIPKKNKPICGCDGLAYDNDCKAEKAGVTEWTKGECE
tara:strand:- start:953 stop:1168 length:216 start_codon:yes stop_codon:yes gene_type:complete